MPGKNALLSAACLVPFMATAALAQNAGVTAAVNQSATGTPPGRQIRTIALGDNIVQNERIDTSGAGLVQILLADGTAFTVGPSSSIVIDRFVYDPATGTAEVAATLSRGVFRFVGGRTSKTPGGVALQTPVGTVGIRGAVADLTIDPSGPGPRATFSMVFGDEITLRTPDGDSERVYRPGYTITVGRDGTATTARTPPGAASSIQTALAGRPGTSGGSPNVPADGTVAQSPVPGANSDRRLAVIAPPVPTPRPVDPNAGDGDLVRLATLDVIRYEIAQGSAPRPPEPQPPQPPEPQPPVQPEPQPPVDPEPQPPVVPDPQPPVDPEPQPPVDPEPQPPVDPEPQPPVDPEPQPPVDPEPQPPVDPEPQPPVDPEPQPPVDPEPQPPVEPPVDPEPEPGPQLRTYLGRPGEDPRTILGAGIDAAYTLADGRLTGTIGWSRLRPSGF